VYRKLMALLIGVAMLGLVIGLAGCPGPKRIKDVPGTGPGGLMEGYPPPPAGIGGSPGSEEAPAEEAPAEEVPAEEVPAEEGTAP